jgi:hypothetical protein
MVGMAVPKPALQVGDLALEVVDQHHRGGHVRALRLGDLEPREQAAAGAPEQIGDRTGTPEVDQGRVDAVLERRLVPEQVKPKASELALFPDVRIRKPDRRDQVAVAEHREHQ